MPVVDPTKANFDKSYTNNASAMWYGLNGGTPPVGEKPVWLNYNRFPKIRDSVTTAQILIDKLGLTASHSIAAIGAGFGWVSEKIAEQLPGISIVAVDTSPYIHGAKDTDETDDINAALDVAGITDPTRRAFWLTNLQPDGVRSKIDIWL